uniref:Uncharacterized protein n=1 Tax=Myotis myotis TaxID=51298 RepID=A0A7J7RUT9_MYOMY|nr:hypothetical protein mMyoMyo1_010165 [Myotis myotis]
MFCAQEPDLYRHLNRPFFLSGSHCIWLIGSSHNRLEEGRSVSFRCLFSADLQATPHNGKLLHLTQSLSSGSFSPPAWDENSPIDIDSSFEGTSPSFVFSRLLPMSLFVVTCGRSLSYSNIINNL